MDHGYHGLIFFLSLIDKNYLVGIQINKYIFIGFESSLTPLMKDSLSCNWDNFFFLIRGTFQNEYEKKKYTSKNSF